MPTMVTKDAGIFIAPNRPTHSGTLPRSSIDKIFSPGSFMGRIFVFKHGPPNATDVIRQALSKALVLYYPLTGRLLGTEVSCTGDGIWFVGASAECSLQELEWLEDMPLKIPTEDLISYPPDPVGVPLIIQVTQFACCGIVLSFTYDHAIGDGVGMAQFMIAVSEIARGLKNPTVEPIWSRDEAVLNPPSPPLAYIPSTTIPRNLYFHIDTSSDQIQKLKNHYKQETGLAYSTFEVLAAKAWQSRAMAITADREHDLDLVFLANVRRHLLRLPVGYYGNCIFPLSVTMPTEKLIRASTVEVMDMIREEKERLAIKVSKWSKGEEEPPKLRLGYHTMFMAVWTWHGFEEVDFGWGKPSYVTPTMHSNCSPVAYFVRSPVPKKGVRLITQCVVEEHLKMFKDQMMNALATL